jgi:hypothetical protein
MGGATKENYHQMNGGWMNTYPPKLPSNLKSSPLHLNKNDVYAYTRVYQSPAEPKLYKEKARNST